MEQEKPKEFLINTNDRFTDFCGSMLFGLETSIENWKRKSEEEARLADVRRIWVEFFRRLDAFMRHGFEPEGNITEENIRALLAYRERDITSDPEALDEMKDAYRAMVAMPEEEHQ